MKLGVIYNAAIENEYSSWVTAGKYLAFLCTWIKGENNSTYVMSLW